MPDHRRRGDKGHIESPGPEGRDENAAGTRVSGTVERIVDIAVIILLSHQHHRDAGPVLLDIFDKIKSTAAQEDDQSGPKGAHAKEAVHRLLQGFYVLMCQQLQVFHVHPQFRAFFLQLFYGKEHLLRPFAGGGVRREDKDIFGPLPFLGEKHRWQ